MYRTGGQRGAGHRHPHVTLRHAACPICLMTDLTRVEPRSAGGGLPHLIIDLTNISHKLQRSTLIWPARLRRLRSLLQC